MNPSSGTLTKDLLANALNWFQPQFRQNVVFPIESQFANYALPSEIQAVLRRTEEISQGVNGWQDDPIPLERLVERLGDGDMDRPRLFKQILLFYRRYRAAETERLTEKTFHLELARTLEEDVKALDGVVNLECLQGIETLRLPRLKDFLPVQFIESVTVHQIALEPRQYDEKFHILQAPNLFLQDLAYFRAKSEDRETPLAVAFLDIDHFKKFNTDHTETKIDRNLLPRFMQTLEAHVFHHGYAYRQGGDEYLLLIPSLSRSLAIAFLDELRLKLANLNYPDITGKATVSIGLCIAEADCPLTDRELRDRASQAKKFAKDNGRNRIATYEGQRFIAQELRVVKPEAG